MDFGALPPEVNSGRLYRGPGSESMHTAAAAWDRLADELHSSATGFNWAISELTGAGWSGPSSASMAAATLPLEAWMTDTATQAQEAAAQARAAAAAYDAAFAMAVPPALIAANRHRLTSLASSSFFAQNAHAIADTEACYEQMWAQDAGTMYRYAAASAAASVLAPFISPPEGAAGGWSWQARAAGIAGTSTAQVELSQLTSTLPRVLQALAQPWQSASAVPTLCGLSMAGVSGRSAEAQEPVVSAAIRRAGRIGRLSVPKNWTGTAITAGRITTIWQGERGSLVSEIWVDEPETLSTGTDGYSGDPGLVQWAPPPRLGRPAGWRRA